VAGCAGNGVPYSEDAVLTEYFDRFRGAKRRGVAGRHHDGDGSKVPESGLRDQFALQEGAGWLEVESAALQAQLTLTSMYSQTWWELEDGSDYRALRS
jgi:hypothetical protein